MPTPRTPEEKLTQSEVESLRAYYREVALRIFVIAAIASGIATFIVVKACS